MLRLSFHGAMQTVGCSSVLLESEKTRLVLDYGVKPREVPPKFPIEIKGNVDAILLSHAHLDHSGAIPLFFLKDKLPKVFAIDVTKPLTKLLLLDSIKVSREEGVELPFSKSDVKKTMQNFVLIDYKEEFEIGDFSFEFLDAGHIPGSACIKLYYKDKTILYTGDIKIQDTRLLKGMEKRIGDVDILITESTYADREHPDRKEQEKELIKMVRETLASNGVALIACFAVGRAQEILLVLYNYGIEYPLYMDGMARKATVIINKFANRLKDPKEFDKALDKVEFIKNQKTRKRLVREPCVILTTSGMLQGGPILYYLRKLHKRENCSLILTGWQLEDTPGRILLETGRYVNPKEGLDFDVKMKVKRLDFSAHAGRSQLFKFIEKANPEKIFCIHGDHTEEFARELRERGFDAVAPVANNRIFQLC